MIESEPWIGCPRPTVLPVREAEVIPTGDPCVLNTELQDDIDVPISIYILEIKVHWSIFSSGGTKASLLGVDRLGIKAGSGWNGNWDEPTGGRINGIGKKLGLMSMLIGKGETKAIFATKASD